MKRFSGLSRSYIYSSKFSSFRKGEVSKSLNLTGRWMTVINGKSWGEHKYIRLRFLCNYEGYLSISCLKSLRIWVPPDFIVRLKPENIIMLTTMMIIRINLWFSSFLNPFIDKISKKGVKTHRNLGYLWLEKELTNSTAITIKKSYQNLLAYPSYAALILSFSQS